MTRQSIASSVRGSAEAAGEGLLLQLRILLTIRDFACMIGQPARRASGTDAHSSALQIYCKTCDRHSPSLSGDGRDTRMDAEVESVEWRRLTTTRCQLS